MLASYSSRRADIDGALKLLCRWAAVTAGTGCLAGFLIGAGPAAATTVHVPQDQPTLQLGINATSTGDTVLVAAGTYTGSGNQDLDFGGRNIVFLSAAGALVTIIDCAGNGRGFSFTSGEGPTAEVDGFTVRSGFLRPSGGGPTIDHSPGRSASGASDGQQSGGAILAISSSPTIRHCRFTDNTALAGGAVFIVNCTNFRFEDCTFANNEAGGDGGGILAQSSTLQLNRCSFTANRAGDGDFGIGGGVCAPLGWLIAEDCIFTGNQARSVGDDQLFNAEGGGVFASGVISLTRCLFEDNAAEGINEDTQVGNRARGGGAALLGNATVLTECIFLKNRAECASGPKAIGDNESFGGGLFCDGAVLNACIFGRNTALTSGSITSNLSSGGGVYGTNAVLIDCLIRKNEATSSSDTSATHRGEGGGISIGPAAHLVGCTLSGNSASTAGGGLYMRDSWIFRVEKTIIAHSTAGGAVGCFSPSSPFFTCCDIFDNTGGNWSGCIAGQGGTSGNFGSDPLFCDLLNDNYGLNIDSQCAPGNSPGSCGLIGALPVSCGLVDVADLGSPPEAPAQATLMPNPIHSNGLLAWHNESPGETKVRLYDATGRIVLSRELGARGQGRQQASWAQVTSGEAIAAGVYFLRVEPPASEEQVVRVVVTR
jgi:predicted outer membrane repeat protein